MIRFNKEDEGRYFISVFIKDGSSSAELERFLFNDLHLQSEKRDENELLIPINQAMNYSLNHLSTVINRKHEAVLHDFIVDMEEPYQRYSAHKIDYRSFDI